MKKIIVASKNPVKINAAKEAFEKMFPKETFELEGISVPSGVPDQPMSDEETFTGAKNRADNASLEIPDADFWVGMEGGCLFKGNELEAFAWMIVKSKDGTYGKGKAGTFFLPRAVADLVGQGKELGHATDEVFDETNSKQKGGSIGFLTDGLIDRKDYYVHPMIMALIPFKNNELYE